MTIRYPRPLSPGDLIGVTAPSAGVPDALRPRLEVAIGHLRSHGFDVRLGRCLGTPGPTSAPAAERAAELTDMLTDPEVRAVVPPWGGVLAMDLLRHLDWDRIAAAEPTWMVGYSDVAMLLTALTVRTGTATLHGQNLMDTPYRVPAPLLPWLDVVTAPAGAVLTQGPSRMHRGEGFDDWVADPTTTSYTLTGSGTWGRLDGEGDVQATGRLLGGCIEVVANLAGTPEGDLAGFVDRHAPEGLLVHLEAAEASALEIGRRLHGLRRAGWFDHANAVLVARTHAPDSPGYSQRDAVADALGDLGVPVLVDVDCGHVPPHLALVNGALATVRWTPGQKALTQTLV
ncbi:S66 family peptidase [Cellulomonas bogoriensis]|uniref:Peptidase S66 family protein n=1 Tax=Cellulomonas bogoriensis 69B4 = DSM 16987 TaxID=1386082 RepID=A0A0A0C4V5_9CELL|nr:S66 peptidase family protein [Cellulomonas bogoriensis]KGM14389.1 peptidase S66 family protein [Cellulomonas bogoriensis 69B4 = DSM 16987]